MSNSFVAKLEERGYFKGLPPEKAQALKDDFERLGWMGIFSESHRFYPADAEDLAEGGISRFIREAAPFLIAQGVRLPEIQDSISEDGYTVHVDGVACQIYGATELERDTSGEQMGLIWGLSMVRGFRIVGQLLAAAGSTERVYAVNGGNDCLPFF